MGLAYKLRCLRSQTTTMGLLAGPSLNQAATEWLRSTRSGRSSHPVAEFQHGCSLATGTQARTGSWPSTRTSKSDRSTAEDPNINPTESLLRSTYYSPKSTAERSRFQIRPSVSIFQPLVSHGAAFSDEAIALTSSFVWNDAPEDSDGSILIGSSLSQENTATISFSGGIWYENFPR